MSEHFPGFPKPVRDLLIDKPIHLACMTGDPERTCLDCTGYIVEAFEEVYGSLPNEYAVLGAIMDDLRAEEAEREVETDE